MSTLISQFHFLRPWWLLLLLPVAWLGWQWARRPLVRVVVVKPL